MAKSGKICIGLILGVILTPIFLFVLVFFLLYFPPFQNWAVKQVASVASEKTGMQITVSHVNLAFPLSLRVEGVKVLQPNDSIPNQCDTIADVGEIGVDIQWRPLLDQQVEVDELNLESVNFNTTNLVPAARVKGRAQQLLVRSHGIDLKKENVILNELLLKDADVDVLLSDTVPEDTTESQPTRWRLQLEKLNIQNTRLALHMPGDTLQVVTRIGDASLGRSDVDLFKKQYILSNLSIRNTDVAYDNNFEPRLKKFDYNHLTFKQLSLAAKKVIVDSTSVDLQAFNLTTPASRISADLKMDFDAFGPVNPGQFLLKLDASLGYADLKAPILAYASDLHRTLFATRRPLQVQTEMDGNLSLLSIRKLEASLPTRFDAKVNGYVHNVTDVKNLLADISLSAKTQWPVSTTLTSHARYNRSHFDVRLNGNLHGSKKTGIPAAKINATVNGSMRYATATLGCNVYHIDFHKLGAVQKPLQADACIQAGLITDFNNRYELTGFLSDIVLTDSAQNKWRPKDVELALLTRKDSTAATVETGDFYLDLSSNTGYKKLLTLSDRLTNEVVRQINQGHIAQDSLKMVLPNGHFVLHSGRNNIIQNTLVSQQLASYKLMDIDITTSPARGIKGYAQIDSLCSNGMQFDHIALNLDTDDEGLKYTAEVRNDKDNPMYCFRAHADGNLLSNGSEVHMKLYDADDRLGVEARLQALFEQEGIRFRFSDPEALLGYQTFTINPDNYIFLRQDNHILANLRMRYGKSTSLVLTTEDNTDALQDLTIALNNLELGPIMSSMPFLPRIEGDANGDFHVVVTESETTVSSSLSVDKFKYEDIALGNFSSEFVYMPKEDGSHYVDGILMKDNQQVCALVGTYNGDTDNLDANLQMTRLPLNIVNGFIPDQMFGLRGYGDGNLSVQGTLDKLKINGEAILDSAYVFSIPYGVELEIQKTPVRIDNSRLLLDKFKLNSHNNNPIVINGYVDFANTANMFADLRIGGRNCLLVDAKQNRKSEVYGKAYADLFARLQGRVDALQMTGSINVLGTSNLTYLMKDSPLTTDNQLAELVQFTDFSSTENETPVALAPGGSMTIDMSINIDPGVRVFCALNNTKTNYVDVVGGGELRFGMKQDEMTLKGRYELSSGQMKYSLPVIPLKTFNIQSGSYVEFTGDIFNPKLSITALENTKANVTDESGTSRNVLFDCGVIISKTLNDMGLEFVIDAPEDMALQNQLRTKSVEERAKLAVTMLTTGMYFDDTNTSSLSMNSALSSFLSSQISNITGTALRSLDLSLGMDNTVDARTGSMQTDYSFKFAKRFWDNRINVIIGGKVSSGGSNNNANFLDNVAVEYRLTQKFNLNLKAFYDRAVYDYLEGYVGRYGAGVVWKHKFQNFTDIFLPSSYFNFGRQQAAPAKPDSLNVEKNK